MVFELVSRNRPPPLNPEAPCSPNTRGGEMAGARARESERTARQPAREHAYGATHLQKGRDAVLVVSHKLFGGTVWYSHRRQSNCGRAARARSKIGRGGARRRPCAQRPTARRRRGGRRGARCAGRVVETSFQPVIRLGFGRSAAPDGPVSEVPQLAIAHAPLQVAPVRRQARVVENAPRPRAQARATAAKSGAHAAAGKICSLMTPKNNDAPRLYF